MIIVALVSKNALRSCLWKVLYHQTKVHQLGNNRLAFEYRLHYSSPSMTSSEPLATLSHDEQHGFQTSEKAVDCIIERIHDTSKRKEELQREVAAFFNKAVDDRLIIPPRMVFKIYDVIKRLGIECDNDIYNGLLFSCIISSSLFTKWAFILHLAGLLHETELYQRGILREPLIVYKEFLTKLDGALNTKYMENLVKILSIITNPTKVSLHVILQQLAARNVPLSHGCYEHALMSLVSNSKETQYHTVAEYYQWLKDTNLKTKKIDELMIFYLYESKQYEASSKVFKEAFELYSKDIQFFIQIFSYLLRFEKYEEALKFATLVRSNAAYSDDRERQLENACFIHLFTNKTIKALPFLERFLIQKNIGGIGLASHPSNNHLLFLVYNNQSLQCLLNFIELLPSEFPFLESDNASILIQCYSTKNVSLLDRSVFFDKISEKFGIPPFDEARCLGGEGSLMLSQVLFSSDPVLAAILQFFETRNLELKCPAFNSFFKYCYYSFGYLLALRIIDSLIQHNTLHLLMHRSIILLVMSLLIKSNEWSYISKVLLHLINYKIFYKQFTPMFVPLIANYGMIKSSTILTNRYLVSDLLNDIYSSIDGRDDQLKSERDQILERLSSFGILSVGSIRRNQNSLFHLMGYSPIWTNEIKAKLRVPLSLFELGQSFLEASYNITMSQNNEAGS